LVRSSANERSQDGSRLIAWNPQSGEVDSSKLEGLDAVVHLAGRGIASGKWTPEVKQDIRDSRLKGTALLCQALSRLSVRPKVLVSASAVGYYGDRGAELLHEDSAAGTGFLAELCRDWEAATEPAGKSGIRVVNLRIGVVLSTVGGALAKMLLPFQLGIGGQIGSGKQYMSWVALNDLAGIVDFALSNDGLSGPLNAVAPNPVTNLQFTKTLGAVLGRPTILPVPDLGLRLLFGEMGDELLLSGQRVDASKLLAAGYQFELPDLEQALRRVISGAG
jgi:uncharacterized protein (TIGR01777 family)